MPTRPKAAPVPVVLACVHGKGASEVGVAFVPALVEALTAAFGDAQAYVIGMDTGVGLGRFRCVFGLLDKAEPPLKRRLFTARLDELCVHQALVDHGVGDRVQ